MKKFILIFTILIFTNISFGIDFTSALNKIVSTYQENYGYLEGTGQNAMCIHVITGKHITHNGEMKKQSIVRLHAQMVDVYDPECREDGKIKVQEVKMTLNYQESIEDITTTECVSGGSWLKTPCYPSKLLDLAFDFDRAISLLNGTFHSVKKIDTIQIVMPQDYQIRELIYNFYYRENFMRMLERKRWAQVGQDSYKLYLYRDQI